MLGPANPQSPTQQPLPGSKLGPKAIGAFAEDEALAGISPREAGALLEIHGPNVLQAIKSRSLAEVLVRTLREPMFLFLLSAAGLYLVVGDLGEGLFLLGGAAVSVGLVVFQDVRSERALAALRELAEPFAQVMRGGVQQRIPARDLVPGDIVLISEGERIPADAVLRAGDVLTIDESALTGEFVPVVRMAARQGAGQNRGAHEEDTAAIFAGTMLVRGQGLAQITQTGAHTRLGAIGAALTGEVERTPLQVTTGRLVVRLSMIAVIICLMVAAAYGFLRGD